MEATGVGQTPVANDAQFGNDARRGQRGKVDDTHIRHFFGQAQRKSNEVKLGRIDVVRL